MKITVANLRKLIKEEINRLISESNDHDRPECPDHPDQELSQKQYGLGRNRGLGWFCSKCKDLVVLGLTESQKSSIQETIDALTIDNISKSFREIKSLLKVGTEDEIFLTQEDDLDLLNRAITKFKSLAEENPGNTKRLSSLLMNIDSGIGRKNFAVLKAAAESLLSPEDIRKNKDRDAEHAAAMLRGEIR